VVRQLEHVLPPTHRPFFTDGTLD